jgi:tRNA (cmo5U34)-methyltransferase
LIRQDDIWKSDALVQTFLQGVRGGIPYAAEQIDIMLRLIAARDEAVECFLDLGCGDGILAKAILARYPHAQGTLVDFSVPMLERAHVQLGDHGANLQFVMADFGLPEWVEPVARRAPFDVVVSGYAIHHQPDERKQALYGEILNLLKPGGLFVNVEHVASPTEWVAAINDELFVDSLHRVHKASGSDMSRDRVAHDFVHRPDKAANSLAPVETQCAWLRAHGFVDVDCYFKAFELAVFGGRRPKG